MLLLPALIALRRILPAVIGPPLATYVIWRALPYHVPLLLAIPLCLLSLPLYYSASNAWRLFQNARQAEKLGARLPPLVEDNSWIGSVAPRALLANFERGYLGDHLFEWTRKYGWTIRLNMFGETVIQTNEPEYIKAILATNFVGFEKNTQARFLDDILGSGVFNSNGEVWKFHRGITRPFFSRDRISDFEVFDRHTLLALKSLQTRLSAGHPVDFQDLVSRFTIDSATAFLFGTDVRSLHAGLPYPGADPEAEAASNPADAFATAFLAAQLHVARRTRFGLAWPLFEIFDTKHAENLRTIRQFIEPLVNKAIKRVESANTDWENSKDVQEGETMLDYMVKSTRDPSLLYDETLNILLAGRDTTASLLTSTVYALSQHPEVLAKLRAEILAVVGSQRAPTPDDFRQMKFLRAVLNEVLRLWPPVPFNSRKTIDATVWPAKEPGSKPFYIPPETRVLYSVYVMHRRTDLWGPDALSFDPERFLDERIKYITSNNFMFLPFNAGPRICLGQQFAYNEASFFLVRLLQQYSGVQLAPDAQPATSKPVWEGREKVWMKSHFTLYAAGGLWTRFTPASEDA